MKVSLLVSGSERVIPTRPKAEVFLAKYYERKNTYMDRYTLFESKYHVLFG